MKPSTEFRNFRKRFFFTQERLAEVLGISKATVNNTENGYHVPLARTLSKFRVLKDKYARKNRPTSPKWN